MLSRLRSVFAGVCGEYGTKTAPDRWLLAARCRCRAMPAFVAPGAPALGSAHAKRRRCRRTLAAKSWALPFCRLCS